MRLCNLTRVCNFDRRIACALLGIEAATLWTDRNLLGQLLETVIFQELRRQVSWHDDSINFYHYRDKNGVEIVL